MEYFAGLQPVAPFRAPSDIAKTPHKAACQSDALFGEPRSDNFPGCTCEPIVAEKLYGGSALVTHSSIQALVCPLKFHSWVYHPSGIVANWVSNTVVESAAAVPKSSINSVIVYFTGLTSYQSYLLNKSRIS